MSPDFTIYAVELAGGCVGVKEGAGLGVTITVFAGVGDGIAVGVGNGVWVAVGAPEKAPHPVASAKNIREETKVRRNLIAIT